MTKTERELFNKIMLALFLENHPSQQSRQSQPTTAPANQQEQQTGAQTHDRQTQEEKAIHS